MEYLSFEETHNILGISDKTLKGRMASYFHPQPHRPYKDQRGKRRAYFKKSEVMLVKHFQDLYEWESRPGRTHPGTIYANKKLGAINKCMDLITQNNWSERAIEDLMQEDKINQVRDEYLRYVAWADKKRLK